MNKEKTLKQIDGYLLKGDNLAIELVKSEARKILRADPDLHEFIMAMGSCFFTIKEGGKYDLLGYTDKEWDEWCESDDYVNVNYNIIGDDVDYQPEFFEMVNQLNQDLKVMGYPVRFTATSKEVYDWGDTIKDPVKYEELT